MQIRALGYRNKTHQKIIPKIPKFWTFE